MRKIKKLALVLLSVSALALSAAACNVPALGNSNSTNSESSEASEHSTVSESAEESFPDSEDSSNSEEEDVQEEDSSADESVFDSEEEEEKEEAQDHPDLPLWQETVDLAYELENGDYLDGYQQLTGTITRIDTPYDAYNDRITVYFVIKGRENKPLMCYRLTGEGADVIDVGDVITVYGRIKNYKGIIEFDKGCLLLSYESDKVIPPAEDDPYVGVSANEFYADYTPATDYADAYYRSKHGFMSGELTVPDQAPTLASNRPQNGNQYIRNSEMLLSEDGTTYTVVDVYGNAAFQVFKNGAYITLEEVAAYVYAFGTYPANYTTSKNESPSSSVWGEYLRLNHTAFSGDTYRYPYEPELPNISGCGGSLHYYEMDIGTTGTDCDPSYPIKTYNDGVSITRGAARIVYGKEDLNGNGVYEIGEFHVFYTYNHYNDFQEYLNYEGGWGETFGNVTGGGTLSSTSNYNPTPYVEVSLQPLPEISRVSPMSITYFVENKSAYLHSKFFC